MQYPVADESSQWDYNYTMQHPEQFQQQIMRPPQELSDIGWQLPMQAPMQQPTPMPMHMMPQVGMDLPQMQMPQMPIVHSQMPPLVANGDGSPTEIDRCMAIVMPGTTEQSCDKDLVALQLRAAAELQQCYED
jgi:hypothetical protein